MLQLQLRQLSINTFTEFDVISLLNLHQQEADTRAPTLEILSV